MSCEEVRDLLVHCEEGGLDAVTQDAVTDHLSTCSDCRREQVRVAGLLSQLTTTLPELPDRDIEMGFLRKLAREKRKLDRETLIHPATRTPNRLWVYWGIAATVALIAGFTFFFQQRDLMQEMVALEKEYNQLHKTVALSLIEDQSASKRLQAVHHATSLREQDLEIIEALIDKMRHDKHVNVRLAAASALARFSENAIVTTALVNALKTEQNSNMQIEIIQILVNAREKKAVPVMRRLLQRENVLPYVKEQLNAGLNQII